MALRDWFSNKRTDEIERALDALVDDYDVPKLVETYKALSGNAARVLDQPVPRDRAIRDRLRQRCLDAIAAPLGELDYKDLVLTIADIDAAQLPIDYARYVRALAERDARSEAAVRATFRTWALDNDLGQLAWACVDLYDDENINELTSNISPALELALREAARATLRSVIPTPTAPDYAIARARLSHDLMDDVPVEAAQLAATNAGPAIPWPTNPELERAIAEATTDDEHREASSILADWLHQHAHPQGELIALGIAAESDPALEVEVRAHVAAHANTLLGPLARFRVLGDSKDYGISWRRGRIDRALISLADPDALEILDLVLLHKSLRELAIGINVDDEHLVERAIWLVANRPHELEALHFCDLPDAEHKSVPYRAAELRDLLEIEQLRTFVAIGKGFELQSIELPNIERFAIETSDQESLEVLANAEWNKLRSLELWCDFISVDRLARVLEQIQVPALYHLELIKTENTDELVDAIAAFTPKVRELDLSFGKLTDVGARALAEARLEGLDRLDVTRNHLTKKAIAELRAVYPRVIAFEQEDDE